MPSGITGNFAQVQAALLALIPRIEAAGEVIEGQSAEIIGALAAQKAPKLTGHMAASVDEEGGRVIVDTPYAGYQEYGTRHNAAQPFLRPAKDQAEPIIKRLAERTITLATR